MPNHRQFPTPEAQTMTADKAALLATDLLLDNFHWSKVSDADYDIFRRELERRLMLVISPENIKRMVDRFLQWKLPDSFNPDGGITFQRAINQNRPTWPQKNEPVGTNLLDADQAEEMVRYMLDGLIQSTPPEQRAIPTWLYKDGFMYGPEKKPAINPDIPAARPEAVRMPIELPSLDVTEKERYEAETLRFRCAAYRMLKADYLCRERQLLAALTELQTERAAHERTKEERDEHKFYAWDYLRTITRLRAELASLRSEHAAFERHTCRLRSSTAKKSASTPA